MLIVQAALAVALWLLCNTSVLSQPPVPSAAKESETPSQNSNQHQAGSGVDQNKSGRTSVIVNVGPPAYTNPISQGQSNNQNKEPTTDWWIVVPTWLLAFFTGGLFAYTARLWSATRKLVEDAKDTAHRQLRAYIWHEMRPDPRKSASGYRAFIVVNNSGVTPAHNVRTWARIRALDHLTIAGYEFELAPKEINTPPFAAHHGSRHTHSEGVRLTTDEQRAVEDGVKHLYLWGDTRYRDAFGENRTTKFRLFWRVRDGLGIWEYCDDGNDAD